MAVKKKGLGRGIDSLIPQTDTGNKKEKVKEKPVVKEVIKEVVKEVKVPVPAETMMKISTDYTVRQVHLLLTALIILTYGAI